MKRPLDGCCPLSCSKARNIRPTFSEHLCAAETTAPNRPERAVRCRLGACAPSAMAPPKPKPAVRQYSAGHTFLKAKKADKGAFEFEPPSDEQEPPLDTKPPAIARTRSQARFLPVALPRKTPKKKKGAPAPPSPKKQLSVKVPTHYQSGWWITPFSPNPRSPPGSSSKLTDSLKKRFTKKRHLKDSIDV